MRKLAIAGVIIIGLGVLYFYNWECVSRCMVRGGLYQECVKQCGG